MVINECNNINDRAIKIKPIDAKTTTYIDFEVENNDKDSKSKVGYRVRISISKYKNMQSKLVRRGFMIKKVKNTVPSTYVIQDLNGEETVRTSYEKELLKTNQTELRVENVIKVKGDKFM